LVAAAALLAGAARAAPVYGTDASGELTGTRDVHLSVGPPGVGGLTGFGAYADAILDFTVDWLITMSGPADVHYTYTFTNLNGSGQEMEISHFTLDLSDDCSGDPDCVTNARINGTLIASSQIVFGDFDGIVGGVKFDIGAGEGVIYEFDSNRAPVYGHLAIKDGDGPGVCPAPGDTAAVCNNGLLALSDTQDAIDYVARPDGIATPEPGALALLALGLVGARYRRR
jgi:hypothetical protein